MPPPIPGSARRFLARYLRQVTPAFAGSGLTFSTKNVSYMRYLEGSTGGSNMRRVAGKLVVSGDIMRGSEKIGFMDRVFSMRRGHVSAASLKNISTGGGTGLVDRLYRQESMLFRGRGISVSSDFASRATEAKFMKYYGGNSGVISTSQFYEPDLSMNIVSASWRPVAERSDFIRHNIGSQSGRLGYSSVRSNATPIVSRRMRTPRV